MAVLLGICFLAVSLAENHDVHAEAGDQVDAQQLLSIVESYAAENFPDWLETMKELSPVVTEEDAHWQLTYELPENSAGGVPVFRIDKESLEVIQAYHTQ